MQAYIQAEWGCSHYFPHTIVKMFIKENSNYTKIIDCDICGLIEVPFDPKEFPRLFIENLNKYGKIIPSGDMEQI
jgi:hypothetical protein